VCSSFPVVDARVSGPRVWIVRAWFEVGAPLLGTVCKRDLLNAISYAGCSATPMMPGWGGMAADLHQKLMLSRSI
jgi:hypothetical protein